MTLGEWFARIARFLSANEAWPAHVEAFESFTGEGPAHVERGSSPIDLALDDLDPGPTEELCALIDGLRGLDGLLSWRQNPTYVDAEFLRRYAYCELVGANGFVVRDSISAGLLYLAPDTFYPAHHHPAEETYFLLAGTSEWAHGAEGLTSREPGARMDHPSGVSHSMRSGSTPMLALYLWRGDLATPARLDG